MSLRDDPLVGRRYDEWNRTLAARFFSPQYRGRPVYLQVDDETLEELAPTVGVQVRHARWDFILSVRSRLNLRPAGRAFFWRFAVDLAHWEPLNQHQDAPPPFIALLGLCVLAASHMQRDSHVGIASHNYYARLNELLGWKEPGQPPDFEQVDRFWDRLNQWLNVDQRGRLGIATAAPVGRLVHIGYPISQALLRASDRAHLPAFFVSAGIPPRSEIEPEDLLDLLISWCQQTSCPLSNRARNQILTGSKETRLAIAGVAAREAQLWDGDVKESTGRRVAPLVLWIDPTRGGRELELHFFPKRPEGFPSGAFDSARGKFELIPLDSIPWYEPPALDPSLILDQGIEFRRGPFALKWAPSPVIVAVDGADLELGGYTSQPRVPLGQRVLVLARSYLQSDIEDLLNQVAAPGWRRVPAPKGLPEGWLIYLDIVVQARPAAVRPELEALVPAHQISINLSGGLKLDSHNWLQGAEPRVQVSCLDPEPFDVAVDGRACLVAVQARAELDLSNLSLSPGHHVVAVRDRQRGFDLLRSSDFQRRIFHPSPQGPLAHVLVRNGNQYCATFPSPRPVDPGPPKRGEIYIAGSRITGASDDLPENIPQPILLQGGARHYILLGPQPGMVFAYDDPRKPAYAFERRYVTSQPFDVLPPFQPAWLVRISWKGKASVTAVGTPVLPSTSLWPGGDTGAWKRWFMKRYRRLPKGPALQRWHEYARVARTLGDE